MSEFATGSRSAPRGFLRWWSTVAFVVGLARLLARGDRETQRRYREGQCLNCGYDLRVNPRGRCPECGKFL